jgi:hypothetical protein
MRVSSSLRTTRTPRFRVPSLSSEFLLWPCASSTISLHPFPDSKTSRSPSAPSNALLRVRGSREPPPTSPLERRRPSLVIYLIGTSSSSAPGRRGFMFWPMQPPLFHGGLWKLPFGCFDVVFRIAPPVWTTPGAGHQRGRVIDASDRFTS